MAILLDLNTFVVTLKHQKSIKINRWSIMTLFWTTRTLSIHKHLLLIFNHSYPKRDSTDDAFLQYAKTGHSINKKYKKPFFGAFSISSKIWVHFELTLCLILVFFADNK